MSVRDWTPPDPPDWEHVRADLSDAIAEAFGAVVRWEWQPVDSLLEDPRPFPAELRGRSPVRSRRPGWTPKKQVDAVQYGRDERGRIRVARRFVEHGGEVVPADDMILTFYFSPLGDHLTIYRTPRPNGVVPVELRSFARRSVDANDVLNGLTTFRVNDDRSRPLWVHEHYTRNVDGAVTTVVSQRDLGDDHQDLRYGASQRRIIRMEGKRDVTGSLVALRRQEFSEDDEPAAERELIWRRTDAEEVRAAERIIAEQLPVAIGAWVDRVAPEDPAYCLCVLYGETWGPSLGIGTTADLAVLRPGGAGSIWNPAEFRCFEAEPAELHTEALRDAYRVTSQHWGSARLERIRKACLAAAAELHAKNLALSTMDAFVVYAADTELDDLDANFRKLGLVKASRSIEKTVDR